MARFVRLLVLALLPLSLSGALHAEGLVQLTLRGELASAGGAPVEIHLGFWNGERVEAVDLRLHLARGTTAHDLRSLLARRLDKAGADYVAPPSVDGRADRAQLFLEQATLVSLRLGHGLSAAVTTTEGAPENVHFLAPLEVRATTYVQVCVSTYHPHSKEPGRAVLNLEVSEDAMPSDICQRLFNDGLAQGLVCDRSTADRWRPTKTDDGAGVTGCSIDLGIGKADWGLEVLLEVPRPR